VRHAGIDVRGSAADDRSPSRSAADLLRTLAEAPVRMAPAGEGADRYGRRHAYVFLADGRSAQEALLAAGLARARWYPGEDDCFAAFLAAERSARRAGKGLWGLPAYAIQRADDPSLLDRGGLYAYAVVEGRVVSVGHGAYMIFLDFGHSYRRDFTVMLPLAIAEGLAAEGFDVDGVAGRVVQVRGMIEESGGPAIRLNDPAEIELIDSGDGNGDGAAR
jgi:hypothetical protein